MSTAVIIMHFEVQSSYRVTGKYIHKNLCTIGTEDVEKSKSNSRVSNLKPCLSSKWSTETYNLYLELSYKQHILRFCWFNLIRTECYDMKYPFSGQAFCICSKSRAHHYHPMVQSAVDFREGHKCKATIYFVSQIIPM